MGFRVVGPSFKGAPWILWSPWVVGLNKAPFKGIYKGAFKGSYKGSIGFGVLGFRVYLGIQKPTVLWILPCNQGVITSSL